MVELWDSEEITLDGMRISEFFDHGIATDIDDMSGRIGPRSDAPTAS